MKPGDRIPEIEQFVADIKVNELAKKIVESVDIEKFGKGYPFTTKSNKDVKTRR